MAYYHVLLSLSGENAPRCVFTDLLEDQLKARFVTPYRRGQDVLCGNEIVKVSQINKVTIIRTADIGAKELERIQEKSLQENEEINRTSRSMVILSLRGNKLEDIVEAGENVTSSHILGPPGYRGTTWSVVAAVINHPWVSAIVTGLIVAAVTW